MRRALLALVGTATGTALLVGAKAGHAGTSAAPTVDPSPAMVSPSAYAYPSMTSEPGPMGTGGASSPASDPRRSPAVTTTHTTDAPRPVTTSNRPHTSYLQDGTWTGSVVFNDYGDVEVKIVVSDKKITNVINADWPQDRAQSAQISGAAVKTLRSEALAAQSATINSVSGATETSDSYKQSLQHAIDVAHGD